MKNMAQICDVKGLESPRLTLNRSRVVDDYSREHANDSLNRILY